MADLLRQLQTKVYVLGNRVRKLAEPEGEWKTINGRHVLVGKGETPLEALNKSLVGGKAGDDTKDKIASIDLKIRQISGSVSGNDAKAISRRMKLIKPLVAEKERLTNLLSPNSISAIVSNMTLSKSSAKDVFDVNYGGTVQGQIARHKYPGFKTVNGAQQSITKEGWKVFYKGAEIDRSLKSQRSALEVLAQRVRDAKKVG